MEVILNSLIDRLGGRRVTPPVPTGHEVFVATNEDLDAEELADTIEALGDDYIPTGPIALFIDYRSRGGTQSFRRITCKRVDRKRGNIHAFCHERRMPHTFKIAGIASAIIPATGEIVDITTLTYLLPEAGAPEADRRLSRIITILTFMMRCDGNAHPMEREVISDAAARYALRFDRDESLVEQAVQAASKLAPDVNDLVDAINWIKLDHEGHRLAQILIPFIDEIIIADGRIASEEAFCGERVKEALRKIVSSRGQR